MEIVLRLSDSGASEKDTKDLETRHGARLPEDYRQFMLEHNGGRPKPSYFRFVTYGGRPNESNVHYFFTLNPEAKGASLEGFEYALKNRLPLGTIAIGIDDFGNMILLDLASRYPGSIYFWDHENESPGEPWWDNVFYLAPSFAAFIEGLYE